LTKKAKKCLTGGGNGYKKSGKYKKKKRKRKKGIKILKNSPKTL